MKTVCLDCRKMYVCDANGVICRRGENDIIVADRWVCPSCGHQILTGWGNKGQWKYMPNFDGEVDYQLDDY